MARSDLLIKLIEAGNQGDRRILQQTVEALAAEERAKQHHVFADRLIEALARPQAQNGRNNGHQDERLSSLFQEIMPRRNLHDLILAEDTRTSIEELAEEYSRADLLRSYGLEPRNWILLVGPPGNGKTSVAEAIACSLMIPLFVVRYDGLIGSYLGETAQRLRRLLEHVRTYQCVLFFDEFDVVAKERGDTHETGEIKRVVSSLLLQLDELPSHVVVVTATNHPELLDRAVWRRFQLRLTLPAPSHEDVLAWLQRFQRKTDLALSPIVLRRIATECKFSSFSDLEEFGRNIFRRYVLSLPGCDLKRIITHEISRRKASAPIPADQA